MNFGNNLKNFRKSKKMSQEVLAEKIGVTRQSVSKWETGDAYPEMANIICLCKIFHCEITDLINDNVIDNDKFDDLTKDEIILFKKNQQKRMKYISKAICVMSRIADVVMILPIMFLFVCAVLFPFFSKSLDLEKNKLSIFGNEIDFVVDKNVVKIDSVMIEESGANLESFFTSDNKVNVIIWMELKIVFLLISTVFLFYFFI